MGQTLIYQQWSKLSLIDVKKRSKVYIINNISCTKQWNLFLHLLQVEVFFKIFQDNTAYVSIALANGRWCSLTH